MVDKKKTVKNSEVIFINKNMQSYNSEIYTCKSPSNCY